jgi:nucleotide-binding universal stress UspA family protein
LTTAATYAKSTLDLKASARDGHGFSGYVSPATPSVWQGFFISSGPGLKLPGEIMIAIKKILFATDFSDCAKVAQEYALSFANQFHAELHVVHVLTDMALMTPNLGMALPLPPDYILELKNDAKKSLDTLFPGAGKAGRPVIIRSLRTGNPFLEIVKYAEENGVDLIVMGTHGRGALMHLLMGSVAENVVRKAGCPVLSVRPPGHSD